MPLISTATGSFFAGRRASTYSSAAWSPSTLGNDLRMWFNPKRYPTTTFSPAVTH